MAQDAIARMESMRVSLVDTIVRLAREASIEINVQDVKHLQASQAFLPPGKKIYVSHLPKQTWRQTEEACRSVREAGFDPVPHIPVRLITDAEALDRMIGRLIQHAGIQEALLISGDYPQAAGPYSSVGKVLHSGVLSHRGLKRVSVAGHPEGHPQVVLEELRRAEREKAKLGSDAGLGVTFVTQFFFEHTPFLEWVKDLRSHDVSARIVGGLAGPAPLATLFKFAMRCGVGPSIRALGARPSSLMKLMGHHGPEQVMRGLADARHTGESDLDGVHMFCFGGYLRTCEWLHRVASGQFRLAEHSFVV